MHQIKGKIKRKQWIGLCIFIAIVILGYFYTSSKRSVYRSTTWIMVPPATGFSESSSAMPELIPFIQNRSIEGIVAILGSHDFLQNSFDRINKEIRERDFGSLTVPDGTVAVEPKKGTDLIKITVEAYSPSASQVFANSIARDYLSVESDRRKNTIHKARISLQQDRLATVSQLKAVRTKVNQLLKQSKFLRAGQVIGNSPEDKLPLQRQLIEAKSQAMASKQALEKINQQLTNEPKMVDESILMKSNPQYNQILLRIDQLQSEREKILKEYTQKSAEVTAITETIADEERRLPGSRAMTPDSKSVERNPRCEYLEQSYDANIARLAEHSAMAENLRTALSDAQATEAEMQVGKQQLDDLVQQQEILRKQNERLLQLDALLQIQENIPIPRGEIVVSAAASQVPVRPKKTNMMLFFCMLGVVGAMVTTKGIEWLRRF